MGEIRRCERMSWSARDRIETVIQNLEPDEFQQFSALVGLRVVRIVLRSPVEPYRRRRARPDEKLGLGAATPGRDWPGHRPRLADRCPIAELRDDLRFDGSRLDIAHDDER